MSRKLKITKSLLYWKRAEKLIPAGTQTLSKGPTQFVQGVAPIYLKSGKGSHVFDVDGNEYIDYAMALAPVILGYGYPAIDRAIANQLKDGITFTLMHPLEVELAELLTKIIPCAEMVRYGKNGSDATSGAVRVARAYTEREKIACCGYHGWQDWYAITTSMNKGIPKSLKEMVYVFKYNKIETLEKIFSDNGGEIAAVIMEPVGVIEPQDGFLEKCQEVAHENGAVLIFDEIVTGFRIALGGAQEYYGVTPDLACFGKAIANGMPLSVLAGKKEIMKNLEETFFSFTFGGETLSLAAAVATVKEIKKKKVIQFIWKQGRKLKDGCNKLLGEHGLTEHVNCIGLPPRTLVTFKDSGGKESLEMKSLFQQEAIKRGILFTGAHNICFSHTDEDIKKTLEVYNEVMAILKKAIDENKVKKMIYGAVIKPVFREI